MNKRILTIVAMGVLILTSLAQMVGSEPISRVEVYPKPVHAGQDVLFRITVPKICADSSLINRLKIFVNSRELITRVMGWWDRDNGQVDYFLGGRAETDFDWRQVKVRLDNRDYPAGPDDPYMICDAPFRVKSASTPLPLSVTFHDADSDDAQLQFVEVFNDATNQLIASYQIWQWIWVPYYYFMFDNLTASHFNCAAGDTAWIKVVLHCDDHDFPWIPEEYTFTQHLKVRVGRDLPYLSGWYYGDVHTHSQYTNNTYEYGGPLEMFAASAEALGLSFVTLSDHSSDFDASGNLWNQMAQECLTYSTPNVRLIPAEEVNLDNNEEDNSTDNRIHFLNYSEYFIRGPEAPLTGCLDTSTRFTFLTEALNSMESGGGFGYSAHPLDESDAFTGLFGLQLCAWSNDNNAIAAASSAFRGWELWNERNRYYKNVSYWYELNPFPWEDNPEWSLECGWIEGGLATWDSYLSSGLAQNPAIPALLPQKLFIAAGSDAHGDFNYTTYNADPIFYDVLAHDDAFGMLRTAVFVPGYQPGQLPPSDQLLTAYRIGRSVVTDGPLLEIGIDTNNDGDLDDSCDLRIGGDDVIFTNQLPIAHLLVRWESSADWNTVASIRIRRGDAASGSNPTTVWSNNPNNYTGNQSIALTDLVGVPTNGWIYLRAEAFGAPLPDDARRAYTNPIWLQILPTPNASVTISPQTPVVKIPQSGGSFQYTITAQNQQTAPLSCNVWVQIIAPNGQTYPVFNAAVNLSANQAITRSRTQTILAGAPAGDYVYRANVGIYPNAWYSDAFAFLKLGVGGTIDRSNPESELKEDWQVSAEFNDDFNRTSQSDNHPMVQAMGNSSQIAFRLSSTVRGPIRLAIFDIAGRKITEKWKGSESVEVAEVNWQANTLPSGVYLYLLEAPSWQQTGKIALIK